MFPSPPVVLTIAGSDSSAGAGLQADLKTFAAHGVYGVCAVTALVAEVPGQVLRIDPVASASFNAQLEGVDSAFPISGIKTGMLATGDIVAAVVASLRNRPARPLVVDPVIRAGTGAALLTANGVELLRRELLPLARLVTPNLPEAEILLDGPIRRAADFAAAPRRIHERYGCDVLLKGGHFAGDDTSVTDHAWIDGEALHFTRPRLPVPDIHGTGCTLSAAITARLALGDRLATAVSGAIRYLTACLSQHHAWDGPRGDGPRDGIEALNHFPADVD